MMVIPSGATASANYNLHSFSGYWEYPFCDDVFPFESGTFSLSHSYTYNLNNGLAAGGGGPVFDVYIPSGSFVIIDAYFPDATTTYDYAVENFYLVVSSANAYTGVYRAQACYDLMTSELSLINRDNTINEPIFDSSALCSTIYDSFGSVIGIRLSGTLLADANIISINKSFEYEPRIEDGEEITLSYSFSSYNDLQISVFADADSASDELVSAPSRDPATESGSCGCPSILNSVLSAITAQTNFLSTWQQTWTTRMDGLDTLLGHFYPKLYQIEANTGNLLSVLTPSAEETALKENVKDTTKEVTDSLFAEDAPTKVTASDVKDLAQIGAAASSMFDSGVSIGSFFDTLNDLRFIAFFSQATYDDLNTVPSVSTYSRGEQNGYVDYYSDNLNKIQQFAGGG